MEECTQCTQVGATSQQDQSVSTANQIPATILPENYRSKKEMLMRSFERHGWHTSSLVASREPMAAFKNLRLAIGLGSHLGSHHHNEDEKEDEE